VRLLDDRVLDGEHMIDKELKLFAVGARVMLTMNLWTETGLVNGANGVVEDILRPVTNSNSRVLMVNFPSYRGPSLDSHSPTVVPITQIQSRYFTGLPLTLSWAVTIHKSQGMSLDRVTVDLGDTEFAAGITFVALSRARRFDGLRVVAFDYDRYESIGNGRNVVARREEFGRLRRLAEATISFVVLPINASSFFNTPGRYSTYASIRS
jgi:ATP-dependent exoDNAse (exonuclease V) alpha subunit